MIEIERNNVTSTWKDAVHPSHLTQMLVIVKKFREQTQLYSIDLGRLGSWVWLAEVTSSLYCNWKYYAEYLFHLKIAVYILMHNQKHNL